MTENPLRKNMCIISKNPLHRHACLQEMRADVQTSFLKLMLSDLELV